ASQQSSVKIALQDILQSVGRYLKLELTEAIGPYVDQFGRVQDSYREAKLLLRDAVIHGSNRIYSFNAARQKGPNRKSIISGEDESTIIEMLKQGETDKIHRWTERRMGAIAQDPDSTYVHLEWFCMDLHLLFHKYLLARSLDSEWTIGETEDLLQWLSQVRHWEDVLEQMKRYTANIAGFLSKSGQMQETDMMEAIRQYIATHFGEPLSLQSISEKFFIHPNYFSRRFKEKNGTSFIELLTAYRMKEAESLLRGTELLVHQVAERVGFEDAAYFGSVFRKHYGMTPKQYREQEIS
ncbi:AraC family transcriptional regulator, partial [Paenibacillus sepulcri]|nr:AraC family transcriptional regulator [Paenibacillus sepulcri]